MYLTGSVSTVRLLPLQLGLDPEILHFVHFKHSFLQVLSKLAAVMLVSSIECYQYLSVNPLRQPDTKWIICDKDKKNYKNKYFVKVPKRKV